MTFTVNHIDCLVYLKTLSDNTIDSVVTDPPYGLNFMSKNWDKTLPNPEIWKECLRVLKPGGHMVVFGAPRLYHRLTCQIEDAGFEVRDCLMWLFGSGFPKSLDVSKAIDKSGAVDVLEFKTFLTAMIEKSGMSRKQIDDCCGFTMRFDTAYEKDPVGWGVSLPSPDKLKKIANVLSFDYEIWNELIERVWRGKSSEVIGDNNSMSGANYVRTDKGLAELQAAKQWDGWGTALKPAYEPILLVRKPLMGTVASNVLKYGTGAINIDGCRIETTDNLNGGEYQQPSGRWPANLILDEDAGTILDAQSGITKSVASKKPHSAYEGDSVTKMLRGKSSTTNQRDDSGGASRFFYCAKTSKSEREAGLGAVKGEERKNTHPTVKPLALMRWLVKLITPPGGTVLDPFMGSGSTGCAAVSEGFDFIGCELEEEYVTIAKKRIEYSKPKEQEKQ